ncbi:hypothetical protein ANCDUO_24779, partial [Ancylostoma duodenale]
IPATLISSNFFRFLSYGSQQCRYFISHRFPTIPCGIFSYYSPLIYYSSIHPLTVYFKPNFSVFSTILERSSDLETPYNYIFYVTQTGCIGVSAYNVTLSKEVLGELEGIGPTKTADDWYGAMEKMVNVAKPTDYPLPDKPDRPVCLGVQASIFIAVDLSIGVDEHREQFPTAFNLAYDISVTKQGCSKEDKEKANNTYRGYSRISGWTFFGSTRGVNDPTFCVSNLASVMSSVGNDGGDDEPNYEGGKRNLLKMFKDTLSNTCKCSRYEEEDTKKIVIWMPVHRCDSYAFHRQ